MVLKLEDKWVWDSWYVRDGELWHAYFLQADKSIGDPELRHFNVSQGHAVSRDLVRWDYLGTCFAPASSPAWDDYTSWTGSVIRDDEGLWHLFYTGGSRAEDALYQRIGHATSTDLHNWSRVGDGLCLDMEGPNCRHYEVEHKIGFWHDRAMRDPWVIRDPQGKGWLMYFTARGASIEEANEGGVIGFATSPDLYNWTLEPPVHAGGHYGQLEVPQVFEVAGRWYCLFCTNDIHWSEREIGKWGGSLTGNHYLVGPSARGPFELPDEPFLDGSSNRYAAKILEEDGKLSIIGFKGGDPGDFEGYLMNPERIIASDHGQLQCARPSDLEE